MPMQGKNIIQCACAFLSSTNEKEDIYVWSYMWFKSITQKLSQRKKTSKCLHPHPSKKKTHQTKGPVTQSTLIIKERNNTLLTLI